MTPLRRVAIDMAFRPTERIQNPAKVDRARIEAILATGKTATIQFSAPGYHNALLQDINELCQIFGDELEVRFYGHYQSGFDGKWLAQLPDVVWLSLDCLMTMQSSASLSDLSRLRKLSLGIHELADPKILSTLGLEDLVELRIGDCKKPNMDLAPLARCHRLESLGISAHVNGIDAISRLPALQRLWLGSISKKHSLPRIDTIPCLRRFELMLGGRDNFDELASCSVEELSVTMVRGLVSIGNLARFPSLKHLQIQNQAQLTALDLGNVAKSLEKFLLLECKNLADLGDLQLLASLIHLKKWNIAKTALNLNDLLAAPLPASLRTFGFWTGKLKEDRAIRARLDDLGYDDKYWT